MKVDAFTESAAFPNDSDEDCHLLNNDLQLENYSLLRTFYDNYKERIKPDKRIEKKADKLEVVKLEAKACSLGVGKTIIFRVPFYM